MKIALLIASLSGGGAERVALNLHQVFNENKNNRIQCDLIILNKTGDYRYDGDACYLNQRYSRNALRKAAYHFFLYQHKLRALKKKNRYDAVISFSTLSNLVNIRSKMDEKTIVSVRNYASLIHTRKEQDQIRKEYPKADRVVAVSNQCREDLIDHFGLDANRITTIYNPYQISHIISEGQKPVEETDAHLFDGEKTVISAGRFSDQKAFWRLIKAIAHIKEKIPGIRLVLMGKNETSSTQQDLLEHLIKKYQLEQQVFLIGFKQNPYAYISKSQVFVTCSKYEGFPNALSEAMCLGTPVVSVDCLSGPREILAPELDFETKVNNRYDAAYGILVPQFPQNENQTEITEYDRTLGDAIGTMLIDRSLNRHYSAEAQKRAQDFEAGIIAEQWTSWLQSLVE